MQKVTCRPSVVLKPAGPKLGSRNQNWKFSVWPAMTPPEPPLNGALLRSRTMFTNPKESVCGLLRGRDSGRINDFSLIER